MTTHTTPPDPRALVWTPDDVAAALQVSVRHLADLRREDPTFPVPRMLGRCPRWTPQAVTDWLSGNGGKTPRRGRVS